MFLVLPGGLYSSVSSLLAQACKASLSQPTDTGGLSESKLPRTMGRFYDTKDEVTESSPKWFCSFFFNSNKSRFLGLLSATAIHFPLESSLSIVTEGLSSTQFFFKLLASGLGNPNTAASQRFSFVATFPPFLSRFKHVLWR